MYSMELQGAHSPPQPAASADHADVAVKLWRISRRFRTRGPQDVSELKTRVTRTLGTITHSPERTAAREERKRDHCSLGSNRCNICYYKVKAIPPNARSKDISGSSKRSDPHFTTRRGNCFAARNNKCESTNALARDDDRCRFDEDFGARPSLHAIA
jgi:hypothetical protein